MKPSIPVLAATGLLSLAAADPTWPAPTDEMEEIVFQLQGHRGRLFSDLITPCNNEAAGPGRVTASEWLRVAFHDMSTANRYFGTGGLDASLQFELKNGENTGPGHNTTLKFYSNYLSTRSSMADLIAAGAYASVRACGGPVIPLRLGRIDATSAGSPGVPQPQNAISTFRQQFDRMGFSPTEMIQVTACGHTLGGVHTDEFPDLVPAGTGVHGQVGLDSSVAAFDNKVVTEYIDGTTQNPLVVGPAVRVGKHSDFKVFSSDNNATMKAMASPEAFQNVCRDVLQKMIDVVPAGVVLSDPIVPYTVKPVDMQLTLNAPGNMLLLTGSIRVRTTNLPAGSIDNVVITWKDRNGGNNCGSSATCSTTSTLQGVATGFDDTFGFFPVSALIPAAQGISSFTVRINLKDGSFQDFDNNGNSYPMTDGVIFQKPQSCLLQGTGALTAVALVRNDLKELPVRLGVSYLTPRNTANGNPVPALNSADVAMTQSKCVGQYTFFSASFTIPGGLSYNARVSVSAGKGETAVTDDFNHAGSLGGSCLPFAGGLVCGSSGDDSNSTVSSTASAATSTQTSSVTQTTTSTSTTSSIPTPARVPTLGDYRLLGCYTEGAGVRALSGAVFAYDKMTLDSCMANCTGFDYWGTEYGRECYCSNSLHPSSTESDQNECDMSCAGDPTQFCGAGNRLELYMTTATRTSSATVPTPTGTLARKPTVGAYTLIGCQTEATASRALTGTAFADDTMTLDLCASFCDGYLYFGTEYGRECYCGNGLQPGSEEAPEGECAMVCAGNPLEYCGAGNRLELYRLTSLPASSVSSVSSPVPTTTTTSNPTPPTISPYTFQGCYTELPTGRALSAKSYVSETSMTLESCAAFCSEYKFFGTEYASECYCAHTLSPLSTSSPWPDECSMSCSGNSAQKCGGPSRITLYARDDILPPSPPVPTHPAFVGDENNEWEFVACRTDETQDGTRALGGQAWASGDGMTLDKCGLFCDGWEYFGTEYGGECYCGDGFGEGKGSVEVDEGECGMACTGDGGQLCGAGFRLSVYRRVHV
ncbi:putative fungistatic metabolite [Echria macrotheca]|uniref:Fungistatic metabolite n=1 Tax=Echria macrotheca TaxID=438768 RepID=A0AAJ0BD01_9PEZI|nr:putative fungistatic metabolite [Echria macrotheca]